MALAIDQITQLADGTGQDILNAIILLVALVTLSWHSISVSIHAKEMVLKAKKIGAAAANDFLILAVATFIEVASVRDLDTLEIKAEASCTAVNCVSKSFWSLA